MSNARQFEQQLQQFREELKVIAHADLKERERAVAALVARLNNFHEYDYMFGGQENPGEKYDVSKGAQLAVDIFNNVSVGQQDKSVIDSFVPLKVQLYRYLEMRAGFVPRLAEEKQDKNNDMERAHQFFVKMSDQEKANIQHIRSQVLQVLRKQWSQVESYLDIPDDRPEVTRIILFHNIFKHVAFMLQYPLPEEVLSKAVLFKLISHYPFFLGTILATHPAALDRLFDEKEDKSVESQESKIYVVRILKTIHTRLDQMDAKSIKDQITLLQLQTHLIDRLLKQNPPEKFDLFEKQVIAKSLFILSFVRLMGMSMHKDKSLMELQELISNKLSTYFLDENYQHIVDDYFTKITSRVPVDELSDEKSAEYRSRFMGAINRAIADDTMEMDSADYQYIDRLFANISDNNNVQDISHFMRIINDAAESHYINQLFLESKESVNEALEKLRKINSFWDNRAKSSISDLDNEHTILDFSAVHLRSGKMQVKLAEHLLTQRLDIDDERVVAKSLLIASIRQYMPNSTFDEKQQRTLESNKQLIAHFLEELNPHITEKLKNSLQSSKKAYDDLNEDQKLDDKNAVVKEHRNASNILQFWNSYHQYITGNLVAVQRNSVVSDYMPTLMQVIKESEQVLQIERDQRDRVERNKKEKCIHNIEQLNQLLTNLIESDKPNIQRGITKRLSLLFFSNKKEFKNLINNVKKNITHFKDNEIAVTLRHLEDLQKQIMVSHPEIGCDVGAVVQLIKHNSDGQKLNKNVEWLKTHFQPRK